MRPRPSTSWPPITVMTVCARWWFTWEAWIVRSWQMCWRTCSISCRSSLTSWERYVQAPHPNPARNPGGDRGEEATSSVAMALAVYHVAAGMDVLLSQEEIHPSPPPQHDLSAADHPAWPASPLRHPRTCGRHADHGPASGRPDTRPDRGGRGLAGADGARPRRRGHPPRGRGGGEGGVGRARVAETPGGGGGGWWGAGAGRENVGVEGKRGGKARRQAVL